MSESIIAFIRNSRLSVLLLMLLAGHLNAQTKTVIGEKDFARQHEPENLQVFHQWIRWNNGGSMLMKHLMSEAFALYGERDREIAALKTKEDWLNRQETVRKKLKEIIGPFPEKTPLKPAVTGVIQKKGYRIEKLVYESRPGFYVTGLLYIPDRLKGKAPAVLNLIGHEQESFRAELDQVMNVNLALKGMVVLTIDPPGQGEHVQYFDPEIKFSSIGYSVVEHCYFGNQCFLSGASAAKYFIWDAIRAVDYLISRKDVDAARIGVTGFSGGGTITTYMGALDDRVRVAVPSSWSTANRRQLETKGAQDAEATFNHGVLKGITLEDLIEVRAPKPTLMTFVSRDEYLCLQGAREAYVEAKKAYEAFSAAQNLVLIEDDSRHWLTPKIRESIYSFFMKHFGIPGEVKEVDVDLLPIQELLVTKTGQISTSLDGEMIFDVHKSETANLIAKLERSRENVATHLREVKKNAPVICGYRKPLEKPQPFINGRYQREGYTVAKYAIRGEGDYAIPILLFVPDDSVVKHCAIVYLHPQGKITESNPGGEIGKLVNQGFVVAAADVLGVGETSNNASADLAPGYTAVMIGRSVVGIQAGDIVRVVNFLKSRDEVDGSQIGAVGIREMCLPLIHAAAFDESIANVGLVGSLVSYRAVAMNRLYKIGLTKREGGGHHHPYDIDFSWGVSNVLTAYDLPDLIGTIAPRKILLAGLTDETLEPASQEVVRLDMAFPESAYRLKKATTGLKVISATDDLTAEIDWLFE